MHISDIKKIILNAKEIAVTVKKEELLIDPQGRILIDVTLNNKTRVTVSLDIFDEFKEIYKQLYGLDDQQVEQLKGIRGSIIPLQQEYYFHLALAARTYTALNAEKFPQEQMALAHQKTMVRVHSLIRDAFKQAIDKATNPVTSIIDGVKLIQALDNARKSIAPKAHSFLLEEIVTATGVSLNTAELKKMDFKHMAEITTATPNDLIHVDQSLSQITWIQGSAVTAHDRGVGKIAARQIMTFSSTPDNANQEAPRVQIRIPSLDVKEGLSEEKAIADIVEKLEELRDKFQISENFTYNLYTALNDRIGDIGGNKQSQGARYILMGMHEYNKKEMNRSGGGLSYCFVQNISVNGFGDTLGYGGNALKMEATLMAEMAMIYNLYPDAGSSSDQKTNVELLMEYYIKYLKDDNRKPFFSQSPDGRNAPLLIQCIKKEWASKLEEMDVSSDNPLENAKAALTTMMVHDLHFQHEYSKLIQALSVFVEPVSIGGCKSGNERAQAINGRVAILDSVADATDNPIIAAINALAKAKPGEVVAKAQDLKQKLDVEYDRHLQSAASLISLVDQGGSAKVNAKKGVYAVFNRNYAEESTLDHLHQNNAGKMQAHKGLAKLMVDAWKGPKPIGFWDYMKSKSGFAGAVVSVIIFPIALIQAVFYSQYKKEEEANFQTTLELCARTQQVSGSTRAILIGVNQDHVPKVPVFREEEEPRSSSAATVVNRSTNSVNLDEDEDPRNSPIP